MVDMARLPVKSMRYRDILLTVPQLSQRQLDALISDLTGAFAPISSAITEASSGDVAGAVGSLTSAVAPVTSAVSAGTQLAGELSTLLGAL